MFTETTSRLLKETVQKNKHKADDKMASFISTNTAFSLCVDKQ